MVLLHELCNCSHTRFAQKVTAQAAHSRSAPAVALLIRHAAPWLLDRCALPCRGLRDFGIMSMNCIYVLRLRLVARLINQVGDYASETVAGDQAPKLLPVKWGIWRTHFCDFQPAPGKAAVRYHQHQQSLQRPEPMAQRPLIWSGNLHAPFVKRTIM